MALWRQLHLRLNEGIGEHARWTRDGAPVTIAGGKLQIRLLADNSLIYSLDAALVGDDAVFQATPAALSSSAEALLAASGAALWGIRVQDEDGNYAVPVEGDVIVTAGVVS